MGNLPRPTRTPNGDSERTPLEEKKQNRKSRKQSVTQERKRVEKDMRSKKKHTDSLIRTRDQKQKSPGRITGLRAFSSCDGHGPDHSASQLGYYAILVKGVFFGLIIYLLSMRVESVDREVESRERKLLSSSNDPNGYR